MDGRVARLTSFFLGLLFVIFAASISRAQTADQALKDFSGVRLSPSYARMHPFSLHSFRPVNQSPSNITLRFPAGATTSRAAFSLGNDDAESNNASPFAPARFSNSEDVSVGGNIPGLTTLPTFQGAFFAGAQFNYTMIGNHPLLGGTTRLPAQITSISLQLLKADGSVGTNVPFTPFEDLTEDSPNFEEANYRSGHHTQFADAVQRAEFFHTMEENWHTLLRPKIVDRVVTQVPKVVTVDFGHGVTKQVPGYILVDAGKPTQFVAMLDLLFQFLNFNTTVNEIINGNYTTDAISMNLYPNTVLFSIDNQGQIAQCCVIGFHTFVLNDTPTTQERWVNLFASWLSPGNFGDASDVTPLSHEISEAFNDPFLDNLVPVWQFPGVPANAQVCQNNLEDGDPVEVLPVSTVNITLRERHEVFTYHPQTEALLQWFEMAATSNAIDGAFSFPDEAALPHAALPCPPSPPAK